MSFIQKRAPSQNNHKISNLWIGFGLGASLTLLVSFFLGTKKGREMLKKILEVSENLEEDVVKMAEEIEGTLIHKTEQVKNHGETSKKPHMGNLLDKMKTLIPSSE
ncbi:hypothetical protein A2866_05095 [Candidatus Roizmanbacteria bacterium RIFCSPHIGHO2_01_FULL_39_8]|uniref:YtxH domain-containing protein n=3 Tax=Candidatus Roizmaniibacteriota TaxID=1752723 RepID=A0A1F7GGY9_9BACT|nr:MAG: hypothetical protein A2866_05095 [Candidatus Roizmanbacteria bacterium RIFCSPHIGHO2_01_FULL_39_8]OGK28464.1 MAG: hypothetical protein A3C28_04080 [Candidatus Roizmanbacteria bacterium RIFCSPHIGHO2_02_FULL_39_9]OGK36578.1 MAG: hypothetical protein A3F60_00965 [Candidatus Roizmanbacteria bacterium RIFCSPHIGHO2_12_FULL_39_8]